MHLYGSTGGQRVLVLLDDARRIVKVRRIDAETDLVTTGYGSGVQPTERPGVVVVDSIEVVLDPGQDPAVSALLQALTPPTFRATLAPTFEPPQPGTGPHAATPLQPAPSPPPAATPPADRSPSRPAEIPVSHKLLLAAVGCQAAASVIPVGTIDVAGNPSIHLDELAVFLLVSSAAGVVYWVFADLRRVGARRLHPLLLGLWTVTMSVVAFVAADRSIDAAYDADSAIGKNGIDYGPGAFVLVAGLLACPVLAAIVIRQRPTALAAGAADHPAPWPTRYELTRLMSNRGVQFAAGAAAIVVVAGVITFSVGGGGVGDRYVPDFDSPPVGFGYQWPESTRRDLYGSCVRLTDGMETSEFYETSCDCLLRWIEKAYPASFGGDVADIIERDGRFPYDDRVVAVVNHCFPDGTM